MKRVLFLSSLVMTGLFASCGDDKKEDPTPKTDSELLMAKTWTQTAETETVGTSAAVDVFKSPYYEACDKDNTLKFMAGNIATMDEGATKCGTNDPQSISGNWALSGKTLTLVVAGFGAQATIQELTDTKLILSTSETVNGATTVTRSTYTGK